MGVHARASVAARGRARAWVKRRSLMLLDGWCPSMLGRAGALVRQARRLP